VRRALLGLTIVTMVGIVAELVSLRHWDSSIQLIPFAALAVLVVALVLAWRGGTRTRAARGLSVAVLVTSAFGVYEHIQENLTAGPLDHRYAFTWEHFSWFKQVWLAATGGVGPAPPLAAAALAQAALLVMILTLARPEPATA
jgi:hypothetical protein